MSDLCAADDIQRARAIIERGWHQGNFKNGDGTAYCIIGALERVNPNAIYGRTPAEKALKEMIRQAYPDESARAEARDYRLTSYFNDNIARSQQDVLDLFDKTLADLGGLA